MSEVTRTDTKIAILTASRGTLIGHALQRPQCRRYVPLLISDRNCGALDVARQYELHTEIFRVPDNEGLSNRVCEYCSQHGIDYIITIFSRLLKGRLLDVYRERIFNLHPSILPAFRGIGAFDKAMASDVRFVGDTFHVVDKTIDGGPIVQQCGVACGYDEPARVRHRLFVAECKMLMQMIMWLAGDRVMIVNGRARVVDALFTDHMFSPALDDKEVHAFDIPFTE